MRSARVSLLALSALIGCVGDGSTEGAAAALECGGDQVCPDGRVCPDDGVCEEPEGDECVCVDDADPELCERWVEWCRGENEDRDPNEDGEHDCDDDHERGACEELLAGCERGDAQACGIWERECRDEEDPGECRCDCPDDGQDDANCVCDCDPQPVDECGELAARCERGEAEACAAWEQQCFDDGQCPCDCPDDDQAGADCRCECDPEPVDDCGELAARCERGEAEACAAWEEQCVDDDGQEPDLACEELRDRCAAGNQEACAALEQECRDADQA